MNTKRFTLFATMLLGCLLITGRVLADPSDANWETACFGSGIQGGGVFVIAISGNDVYVGGAFTSAGGISGTSKIARWNAITHTWSALGSGVNGTVWAIAVCGSDVYVGGEFTSAGGAVGTSGIAKWDGHRWSALPAALGGVNLRVSALAVSPDHMNVYAGGMFDSAGGQPAMNIARWDVQQQKWFPLGAGVGASANNVMAIAVDGASVYAGGNWRNVMGRPVVSKWDGSKWTPVGSGVGNDSTRGDIIMGITVHAQQLYAGIWGEAGRENIVVWNGNSWSQLAGGAGAAVYATRWAGPDLFVGGNFSTAGNISAKSIAMWDGQGWQPLGSGANGFVRAIAKKDGDIYVVGGFTQAGGKPANNIAIWHAPISIATDASPTTGGTTSGDGTFTRGTTVAIHAVANAGYNFINWTEDGQPVGGSLNYAFPATGSRFLVANFKIQQFTIAASSLPTAGGTATGGGTFASGTTVTVHAVANAGYDFVNWTEGGHSVGGSADYALTAAANRKLVANFKIKRFTITTSSLPTTGGTASGDGTFPYGTTVTLHAKANAGYDFVNWRAAGLPVGGSADYAFLATSNLNLVANFKIQQIAITASSLPTTGGKTSGGGIFPFGTTVTVHAAANVGYDFVNWTEGGQSVGGSADYALTATTNRNLVANFKLKQFPIAASSVPTVGGATSGGGNYPSEEAVTLHAKANAGYDFVKWTEGGQTVGGSVDYAFFATTNRTLVANFKIRQFTTKTSSVPTAGGTASGGGTFAYGTTVAVHAAVNAGYDFVNWTEGGQSVGGSADFAFPAVTNRSLVANFKLKQFAIATSNLPKAGGTTSGAGTYPFGTKISLHAAANAGFDFVNWTDGGQSVGGSADFAFPAVTNRNLAANFKLKQFAIATSSAPATGGTTSGSGTYPYGTPVAVHAKANADYDFGNWTEGDQSVSGTADYMFPAVTNRSLIANFKLKQFAIAASGAPTIAGTTSGAGTYPSGTKVSLHAATNAGFDFVNWTEGGQSVGGAADYAFPAAANRNLVANFKLKQFKITVSSAPSTGGTTSGDGTYPFGALITLHAKAKASYVFVNWTEGGQSVSGSADYAFPAAANRNLVANFKLKQFTIKTGSASPAGGTTSGDGTFACGTTVNLQAAANTGYNFVNWTEGGQSVSGTADYAFPAAANRNLMANFRLKQIAIATSSAPTAGGTASGDGTYPSGTAVNLHAVANTVYDFVHWTENGQSVSGSADYAFPATANRNLIANFKLKQFTIATRSAPPAGGTTSGDGIYPSGTAVTVQAYPKPDFLFVDWKVGGQTVSTSAGCQFKAAKHLDLVANFKSHWQAVAGPDGPVSAIAISRATNIIVAGSFSSVGQSLPANNIANWRVSGGWQALGGGANAPVSALAVTETNVYVGGKFASVGNGMNASRVAAYDMIKNQWMTLGNLPIGQNASVNAIGVLGRWVYAARANPFVVFDPILDLWKGENLKWLHPFKLDGPIYAMGAGPGTHGDLFMGGAFTKVDGIAASGIAYWNGTSWHACGAGVKGTVHAIVASGSNVFVGGDFKSAGGQPISYVARWNGTGWSSLGQGVDGVVNAIAVDGGKVYVGGAFTHAGGKSEPVQGVAVYDVGRDDWSPLGSGVDGQVKAIVVDSFSNVYIGGQFNQPSKNFAIWQW